MPSSSGRYSVSNSDLLAHIKSLEDRISKLERTPQTLKAGVDDQGITIQGGAILVRRPNDPTATEGLITLGSSVSVTGSFGTEIGMTQQFARSDTVPGANRFPDGTTVNGNPALLLYTIDGSDVDASLTSQTINLVDKSGDPIFTDTWSARRGMGDPMFPVVMYPPSLFSFTSTSGTFADIGMLEWRFYHPHLLFNFLINNDASTTGQINIHAESDNRDVLTYTTSTGLNQYEAFSVKRSAFKFGDTPNGNSETIRVQYRRSAGAGTARAQLISIYAMDLSLGGSF